MLRIWILFVAITALSAHSAAVHAGPQHGESFTEAQVPGQPLAEPSVRDRIVAALEHRYNARAVRIVDVTVDGRPAFDVRLLSNERVWTVRVDAATGQELPRDN